ncbi:MAG: MarR family transcriptional regulator [Gordonia sp. (in: high G+C Gram-positive bacteria)]|uniref:MarR family winged helix-turn-helix transcriptional regulator n=1 Tax=Gordonia sp. (in: high G+C Gram-positive bacteria) TaxID=84139 RepID=UPI0039E47AE0
MSRQESGVSGIPLSVERELVQLSRRLRNGASDIHRERGLTFVEYSLLALIDDHPGIGGAEIAERARIDKSTASRQITALTSRGLVDRRRDADEPRAQRLHLTEDGRDLLDVIRDASSAAIQERLTGWPDDDVAVFARLLHRFNNAGD